MTKNILKYDAQFEDLEINNIEYLEHEYERKRQLLEKTKIVKQTWSIREIYQKIKNDDLILDPDYQRNLVWDSSKKISFIESLFMGIMIPPIYVVEVPGDDLLQNKKYEVVDGKQRLSTVKEFLDDKLVLDKKYLEYFNDIFGGKNFGNIQERDSDKLNQVLSSILDIYVITSNSPAETKYDIFARLNKGSEPLKVDEIRKAIYRSKVTQKIDYFVRQRISAPKTELVYQEYNSLFTKNDIKRFKDYGRFYRSVAFYINSDLEYGTVDGYNSRPKEMIDTVLHRIQKKEINVSDEDLDLILKKTLELLKIFDGNIDKQYLIDCFIPFISRDWDKLIKNIPLILENVEFSETFKKSKATTANVNKRLSIVSRFILGNELCQ